LLCVTGDGDSIEVAMAGSDSVIGFPGIVRKNGTAFRAQVQVAGAALRVSARVLQDALKHESEIYVPLLDHTHTLSEQIAQATVCSQFHKSDQRLARWLHLVRDRMRYGAFNLTHEAMAQITGCLVQRRQLCGRPATNEGIDSLCPRPDRPSQSRWT
jgi:hypothetical protein